MNPKAIRQLDKTLIALHFDITNLGLDEKISALCEFSVKLYKRLHKISDCSEKLSQLAEVDFEV